MTQDIKREKHGVQVPKPSALAFRSKSEMVAEQLREQIERGEYVEGSVLRQRDIARSFGVSPTPVREALHRLEAEGLVVTELHRGVSVVQAAKVRLQEHFVIRASLESIAARFAAEQVTEEDLEEIRGLADQVAHCDPDDPALTDLNRRLHFRIYESARLPLLNTLITTLWRSLGGGPHVLRAHYESITQHAQIIDALERHDWAAAEELTKRHVLEGVQLVENVELL